jgi:hypothetical protein
LIGKYDDAVLALYLVFMTSLVREQFLDGVIQAERDRHQIIPERWRQITRRTTSL